MLFYPEIESYEWKKYRKVELFCHELTHCVIYCILWKSKNLKINFKMYFVSPFQVV